MPGCYNNSKKQKGLSLHVFPAGKSKEKRLVRKRWIHCVSGKDFVPISGHRVCSLHVQGRKNTYLNNVPTRSQETANQTPVHERKTEGAWNGGDVMLSGIQLDNAGAIFVSNEPSLELRVQ